MSQFINQNKYITIAAAAITLAVLGAAREAQAQARVLVLACPPAADTIAGQINAQPFHQLRATAGDLSAPGTLQQWMSYDALLISSDACIVGIDRAAFGDALADYVDTGRGVVEAVFTQVTNLNPTGRWSGDLYNLIAPNNNNVFSGSALGAISDPAHPLAQGVEALAVSNFRTGQSGLLPGAQAVMSYQDNQVLAAWRGDKAGRVAWLGFAPAEDSTLSGDTTRLMSNALAWVADANSAPTLTSPGAQASAEGQEITLALLADDADGDDLTFRATGLPPGLALGERDGIIRGTISYDASPQSPYSVTVTVSDGVAQAQVSVSWSVSDTNRAPLFPSPGDQTSAEGGNASIPMMATDPDGDALTFRAEGLPPGLSIHPQSGLVSGFLNFGVSAQSPYRATVTVRDGALETARTFFWRVTGTNRPPSLIDPGPLQVAEGASLDARAGGHRPRRRRRHLRHRSAPARRLAGSQHLDPALDPRLRPGGPLHPHRHRHRPRRPLGHRPAGAHRHQHQPAPRLRLAAPAADRRGPDPALDRRGHRPRRRRDPVQRRAAPARRRAGPRHGRLRLDDAPGRRRAAHAHRHRLRRPLEQHPHGRDRGHPGPRAARAHAPCTQPAARRGQPHPRGARRAHAHGRGHAGRPARLRRGDRRAGRLLLRRRAHAGGRRPRGQRAGHRRRRRPRRPGRARPLRHRHRRPRAAAPPGPRRRRPDLRPSPHRPRAGPRRRSPRPRLRGRRAPLRGRRHRPELVLRARRRPARGRAAPHRTRPR
jgi:hypothetical protein